MQLLGIKQKLERKGVQNIEDYFSQEELKILRSEMEGFESEL